MQTNSPTVGNFQQKLDQAFTGLDDTLDTTTETLLALQEDVTTLINESALGKLQADSNTARLNILSGDTTVQQITGLWLVNADTGLDVRQIQRNTVIDYKTDPKNLNIRAVTATGTTPGNVGSVAFYLSGKLEKTEVQTSAPYYAFGDTGGVPHVYNLLIGNYTLFAVPYSASGALGTVGAGIEINITVQDTTVITDPLYQRVEAKIIAQSTMDSGSLNTIFKTEIFTDYALTITPEQSRFPGGKSAKLWMKANDPLTQDSKARAEIKINDGSKLKLTRKFGFSMYFPSTGFGVDNADGGTYYDIIMQEHGWDTRTPPRAFIVVGANLQYKINWGATAGKTSPDGNRLYELGPLPKAQWVDFVVESKCSYGNDGYVNVYMSKLVNNVKTLVQVVKYVGPTTYNNTNLADYPKWGHYKRHFDLISEVILYLDEVRYGEGDANIRDVMPDKDMPIQYIV